MRILVVEDNEFDRRLLIGTLADMDPDATVITAENAARGLKAVEDIWFEVAFVGMALPDDEDGGLRIVEKLLEKDPYTPIALLTTLGEDAPSVKEAMSGGEGVFHFQKPVPAEMVEMVLEAVTRA